MPLPNNTLMELSEFAEEPFAGPRGQHLWTCSSNCYARWSTGFWRRDHKAWIDNRNATDLLSLEARRALWNYDLIIVTEWLENQKYVETLESMFGVPELNRRTAMFCGRESRAANLKFPLNVTRSDKEVLRRKNRIDSSLYNELTSCRPNFQGDKIQFVRNEPSGL